ncbi:MULTISPECIES: flavin monoamine oxidase family protein [unclassified Streptomyces]|uniref:flavin monoamine oxidase family protein n=1 Tax=unclassified Streptomyces TaxID=2593676 RepID=UPI0004C67C67|nr:MULTISPECIES: NAD(P)/FAD-dependent oxidoreductase [unclassified Streptomyces]KOV76493.1 amine oxidase [Streptomyces sp. NRRL WC-3723]
MAEVTQTDVRREFDRGMPGLRVPDRVVVIGAGLSGLAVAYELARRGTDVTVLEASNRPGGRAYTLREPFTDGLYAEAGAMTLTPHCHYAMHYLRELGVELETADLVGSQFSYFVGNRFFGPDADSLDRAGLPLAPHEKGLSVTDMIDRYVRRAYEALEPDITAADWAPTPLLEPYDRRSVYEVLSGRGASPAAIDLVEPHFLEMRGGDLKTASALSWLRHESSPHSLANADPRWSKVKGGTDRFPRAFAERLKDRIRYRAPVVRVAQDDEGARVTFLDGTRMRSVDADRVVVTVPFSAIRHIDFTDAGLSDAKQAVMRRVKYSSIVRVYLQMRRRFWAQDNASFSTDLPVRWVRDATPRLPGPRKILECLITGWRARALAVLSPEERIRFALEHVESMLPGAREHFETGTSVVWDQQPYIEGAYILPEVGHSSLMPAMRRPEGRIHFAGDHTSFEPNGGSMTLALESAARTVLELGGTANT